MKATIVAALALLAGCASPLNATNPATNQNAVGATSSALLYTDHVVYDLSTGKQIGSLGGFDQRFEPRGLCTDGSGNVYASGYIFYAGGAYGGQVYEFAHGGTTPIAKLTEKYDAIGCAVDSTTGNIALSNFSSAYGGLTGSVAVFAKGRGKPAIYDAPKQGMFAFCAYDGAGNLFLSEDNGSLVELARGAKTFSTVTLHNHAFVRSLQWYGGRLYASSFVPHQHGPVYIYRLKVSKGVATVERSTTLIESKSRSSRPSWNEFWRFGGRVIGTNQNGATLKFWKYPAGGGAIKLLNLAGSTEGVAVSP